MEPKLQASFIPKKSVTGGEISKPKNISLFLLISSLAFTIVLLLSIGIFGYNYFLKKSIAEMDTELTGMQKNFQPALITELARTDKRIENAKKILNAHVSASSVFKILEVLTAKTVRFTSFQFGGQKEGSFDVTLDGVGRSYNSVTFQSDIFRDVEAFKNPMFYDLALDESGNVLFKVKLTVEPSLVLYKNSLVAVQSPAVTGTPTSTPMKSPVATTTPTSTPPTSTSTTTATTTTTGGNASSSPNGSGTGS